MMAKVITLESTSRTGIDARIRDDEETEHPKRSFARVDGASAGSQAALARRCSVSAASVSPLTGPLPTPGAPGQRVGMQLVVLLLVRGTKTRSRMMLSSAQLNMKIGAPGGMLAKRLLMISAPGYWVRPMA